ncbi:MAG: EF-P beta-lysylation protein EpmB [Gammaproteobacteria bacterium]|nr:EF-P beta-lysylation protein EpmB [Gammaproteobacteria bacterium]
MINAGRPIREPPRWKRELAQAVRDPAELARLLDLDAEDLPGMRAAAADFRLLVPRHFLARMRKGDPCDPVLRQVLPIAAELAPQPAGYREDALGEAGAMRARGLLVKYRGRALLVTSGACAVHCRYCFRRHYPYSTANPRRADWTEALAAIGEDESIREVILSGGDPLMLDDGVLGNLADRLADIPHVRRLRMHTRLPVVLPERVDAALLSWLARCPLRITLVLHINHANEIGPELRAACQRLRPQLHFLLNQSVLLRGVNDDVEVLAALSEALDEAGILPYYLHLPDRVAGTSHFDISTQHGIHLMKLLRARLPGYLVPRLAREVPGAASKLIMA